MGRTVLPNSKVLEKKESWRLFRKGISKEDQEAFDRLFGRVKFHTHAAVYQAHSVPMETILLSICLEHEKMIQEILRKLKENPAESEDRGVEAVIGGILLTQKERSEFGGVWLGIIRWIAFR